MRTRIALALSILTGLALLGPAAQAARTSGPEPAVPVGPTLTLVSQGYGHGIGMSQYGAKGRAEAGQTAEQILGFYYPGTTRGTSGGMVRVQITGDADHNTIVRPAKGLQVADLATGKAYALPTAKKPVAWRLTYAAGRTRVSWLRSGTWHFYRPGGKLLTGAGEFRDAAHLLTLVYGGANYPYRGAMRLVAGRTVNVVSLDGYLRGVVASEMPGLWAAEALKAQAVAARTYAAFERAANVSRSYQICDTSQCQVYRGYAAEYPTTNAAVAATAGRVVLYAGKPAFTQFSASNGGWVADGGKPYLVAKPDPQDTAYRNRTLTIGPATRAKIQQAYPGLGTLTKLQVLARNADRRVATVRMYGTGAPFVDVSGGAFRSLVGARSSYFSFTSTPPS